MKFSLFCLFIILYIPKASAFDLVTEKYRNSGAIIDARISAFIFSNFLYYTNTTHTRSDFCDQSKEIIYCYYPGDEDSKTIIYAFHGFGNDYKFWGWNSVTKLIMGYWKESKLPKPHVISLSFAKFWTYQKDHGYKLDEFVESIEKQLSLNNIQTRNIYGDSMGGFNALLWFKDTTMEFQGLSLICPAIPFSLIPENLSHQLTPQTSLLSSAADLLFGKQSASGQHFSFDEILQKIQMNNSLQNFTMISVNPDMFGFFEGNQVLADKVRTVLGNEYLYYEIQDFRHCDVDSRDLAERLQ